MKNKSLERTLWKKVARDTPWVEAELRRAEEAASRGDIKTALEEVNALSLADHLWFLGDVASAAYWYRLTAERRLEAHRWFPEHMPSYPVSVDLVRDSRFLVKAGLVVEASAFLTRAHQKELDSPRGTDSNHMRTIGLLAAQLGRQELVPCLQYYIDAQLHMFRLGSQKKRLAVSLFHHDIWAQAHFLLGEYDLSRKDIDRVLEAEETVERQKAVFYSKSDRTTSFEMVRELRAVLDMIEGRGDLNSLLADAESHFESALSSWLRVQDFKYEAYLLRLYLLMAQDVLAGRKPNANPFASDGVNPN